ncbi:MAG: class I SAM-dependent methyltransferase [Proteobacteria bacterium]|nr:class I SAM-dependent methyltransferase [Pseudomonadota bacterium]
MTSAKISKTIDWRCPCEKHARLKMVAGGYVCTTAKCHHAQPNNRFRIKGGMPILVSTRLCDSVCDPAKITFYSKPKAKSLYHRLVEMMQGKNKITRANCQEFVRRVKGLAKKSPKESKAKVLVIGGGEQGYMTESLWGDAAIEIHSVDIYPSANTDGIGDAHYLPLGDEAYDGVWIQAVLEHVVEPGRVAAEIHRVLRLGGVVYAETPFMQQVHGGGHDFTRFTVLGHRYLFREFRLIEMGANQGADIAMMWSLRYFIWAITGSRIMFHLANGFWLVLRPFRLLVRKKSLYDSAAGVYFLGSKSNKREVTHKQLVGLYQGQN